MNAVAWTLGAVTLLFAFADWAFVLTENRTGRYVTKPATLAALVGVAVTLDPAVSSTIRAVMVVGLVLSLAGDVFLLLPARYFIYGLGSFLVAHIAYVVALQMADTSLLGSLVGLAVVVVSVVVVGRSFAPAIKGAGDDDGSGGGGSRGLVVPGCVYAVVLSAMLVSAYGTWSPWAIVGAQLFFISDATLAWNQFLERRRWGPISVMVTYHLGQMGLVAWMVWP